VEIKGIHKQDAVTTVLYKHRERFVVGQVITVWSGGDLIGKKASTDPQQ
jgi:5-keto 4-deoxyuronate isomerase